MEQLSMLNPRQKEAVLHEGNPLLILAGAGSGKTRVITTKIGYMIAEKGAEPRSILAVTFTNKAAEEMRRRVLKLAPGAGDAMIRTFHSFGAWLLRRHSHLLNLNSNFSIYDDDDALSLLKTATAGRIQKDEVKQFSRAISRAKDSNLDPDDDLRSVSSDVRFPDIYGFYQDKLRATGNVDFGDLITLSVELLRKHTEVRKRIQQRFRFILVDEYQDSNTAQFLLLNELHGNGTYLCVVGDEDQSIYRFRGAEVRNILSFSEVFPNTDVIRLEENYRSTKKILEAASRVVENNGQRLGKELWTHNAAGQPIELAVVDSEEEEARFCADILEDRRFDETAILFRNNYQSRSFETVFSRRSIPYRLVGSVRFAGREEVKDALAYLSLLLNPRDEVSFRRIVNKPPRGIGKTGLQHVLEGGDGDFLRALRERSAGVSSRGQEGIAAFLALMENLRNALTIHPLSEVIRELIHSSGLYAYHLKKDDEKNPVRVLNLDELVNAALDYGQGVDGMAELLERLTLNSSDQDPFTGNGRVNLITFHNTKGLEFDRVIITGLEDGLFPHYRDELTEAELDLEEERRLFYVAMTRTRKNLYLTACRTRRVFGKTVPRRLSRFIEEIPEELIIRKTREESGGDKSADNLYRGCGVYHADYGTGIVVRKWTSGGNTMVQVQFFTGKTARFVPKYTTLERITLDET